MTYTPMDVSVLTDEECAATIDSREAEFRAWNKLGLSVHSPRWCGEDGNCIHAQATYAIVHRAAALLGLGRRGGEEPGAVR